MGNALSDPSPGGMDRPGPNIRSPRKGEVHAESVAAFLFDNLDCHGSRGDPSFVSLGIGERFK